MSKQSAQQEAIKRAVLRLKQCDDIPSRLVRLGFEPPREDAVEMRVFGADAVLSLEDFSIIDAKTAAPLKLGDQILLLHYLLCDYAIEPTGEMITFRSFTGGQFYWQPFLSRSINPLIAKIGNDLDLLKKNLAKFDWTPLDAGDFGARISAFGKIYVDLVYHLGDDEFPAAADVIFDSVLKKVYEAEDAAFLAGRICLSLLY